MKRCYLRSVFIAATAFVIAGCGNHGNNESPSSAATIDPSAVGSITGSVTFEGTPPVGKPIDMGASPACVQANPSPIAAPIVVTGDNGALADVVVYVKDGLGNYRFDALSETAVLQQKNCMYEPHIVALMTNQPFEIRNNDPTMHNVHPLPKNNRQWNTSQPAGSAALKSKFARPEFAMAVLCNVHPWMRSLVFVFDNPYFAVTSKTGTFELENLPAGSYTIEAWQEHFRPRDQTVMIAPKESKAISFAFKTSDFLSN